jgi:penicillin G amidase
MPFGRTRHMIALLLSTLTFHSSQAADIGRPATMQRLAVQAPAHIVTDLDGIPHIFAKSGTDLAYLIGFAQARDRLFQLDTTRRQADGTLAELLGPGAVSGDLMTRTFGLKRAAERSANGFDGAALYAQDTNRAAPFDAGATVPDALSPPVLRRGPRAEHTGLQDRVPNLGARQLDEATFRLAREFVQRLHAAPMVDRLTNPAETERGSNAFVVSSRFSVPGETLLGRDPHLPLTTPSFFYQAHLQAPDIDVIGGAFPGIADADLVFCVNVLDEWPTTRLHPCRQSRAELTQAELSVETLLPQR